MLAVRKAHSEGSVDVVVDGKTSITRPSQSRISHYGAEIPHKWWKQYAPILHKKLCPIHQGVTISIR